MIFAMVCLRRLVFAIAALMVLSGAAFAEPLLWSSLKSGPYTVGFESKWLSDPARTYRLAVSKPEGKLQARPILLNVWYPAAPAKSKPMIHREYFNIQSKDAAFKLVSEQLSAYASDVAAKEFLGKAADKRSPEENAVLNRILSAATAAHRSAKAAPGKFPLVVYHAGYGSSFEDNAALCEYLASHGFVVVGSAYQSLDGKSFNIEGNEGSGQDIRFLIGHCVRMPNVDGSHIGYVGHSGGAHTGIVYQTHAGNRIDATVSLDTTQDYYSMADWRWKPMTDAVVARMDEMTNPILFMAGPEAGFDMADRMKFTPRTIFTVDSISHNDYISQGSQTRLAKSWLKPDSAELKQTAATIQDRYSRICEVTRAYLTKHLKGDSKLLDALAQKYDQPVRLDNCTLSFIPVGQVGPGAYDAGKNLPPNPRDIRALISKVGAVETVKILERFKDQIKTAAVYDAQFVFALLFQLYADGKIDDAKTIYAAYKGAGVDVEESILGQAKFGNFLKYVDYEERCYRIMLAVDPGNKKAEEGLKAMGKSG